MLHSLQDAFSEESEADRKRRCKKKGTGRYKEQQPVQQVVQERMAEQYGTKMV
jgi:hypothetical protein